MSLHLGLGASGLVPWGAVSPWPRAPNCSGLSQPGGPSAWRAGLVAGLWVGQAYGVFYLPGHPTSICDIGVK